MATELMYLQMTEKVCYMTLGFLEMKWRSRLYIKDLLKTVPFQSTF